MAEERLTIESTGARLEARLCATGAPAWCCVLAHPHPHFGGDMDNNVTRLMARGLNRLGIASLRFNFRGVGNSTGSFDGGIGETDDLKAALEAAAAAFPGVRLAVAGYSFGAWVAHRCVQTGRLDLPLVLVAPPLALFDFEPLSTPAPTMVIIGGQDQYTSPGHVRRWAAATGRQASVVEEPDADHFWIGREFWLSEKLRQYLDQIPPKS